MRQLVAVVPVAMIIVGIGCGGGNRSSPAPGSDSGTVADAADGTKAPPGQASDPNPPGIQESKRRGARTTVKVGESNYGSILFDGDHQAVYAFGRESSSRSECYGACADAWPPVLTHGLPGAEGGIEQRLLGTTRRTDGTTQVTYNGHPLYYYSDDPRGQVLCQNVEEFGGRWLVVDRQGDAVE
jgi:predicted lipoprotein with Yx(FWY)xxD motif